MSGVSKSSLYVTSLLQFESTLHYQSLSEFHFLSCLYEQYLEGLIRRFQSFEGHSLKVFELQFLPLIVKEDEIRQTM